MRNLYYATRTGWRDGVEQPYDFNVGMTYEVPLRQYVYDLASIWGQRFTRLRQAWPHPVA